MKKILLRLILYGLAAAAAALAVLSFRWYRWNDYSCKIEGEGITVFSDYEKASAADFHRLALTFHRYFDAQILSVPKERMDLKIYLFKDQAAYYNYCRRVRFQKSPFGFYSRRHRLIVINGRMGWMTVFHEMVHYFMHRYGYSLPEPLEEGLAAYFERGMGYVESQGDYLLLFGYLNPVKFLEVQQRAAGSGLTFEDMKSNQYLASTFFVFADRKRAMNNFLEAYLRTQDLNQCCHQAFGMDQAAVERQWTDFIRQTVLGLDYEFWQNISLFFNRGAFEEWLEGYGARWDAEREIYTVNR